MFLDSDDILPENTISVMLDKAFITDADILQEVGIRLMMKM